MVTLERTVSVKWWRRGGLEYNKREEERTELRIGREDPMRQELVQQRKLLEIIFTYFQSSPGANPAWSPT